MRHLILISFLSFLTCAAIAQTRDSILVKNDSLVTTGVKVAGNDSLLALQKAKKQFSPRKASIRSAILPGWGQAYNKKYWKIPIVYGALGTTVAVFGFNITQYRRISFAYRALVNKDTAALGRVDADLLPFIRANASNDLRNYRNEYRKNIDYSVLVFLLFWGLNVVDATVDAHLKGFDVSDDLSLKIKPGYNPGSNTTGISLVFDIHKGKPSSRGFN